MLARVLLMAAAAALAVSLASTPSLDDLPPRLAAELMKFRVQEDQRPGGPGGQRVELHEDVSILLQHVRDGVSVRKLLLPGGKLRGKNRWSKLKGLAGQDELRMQQPQQPNSSATAGGMDAVEAALWKRMQQLDVDMPMPLQSALVEFHATKDSSTCTHPWSLEEDALLLDEYLRGADVDEISIDDRKRGAVQRHFKQLKQQLSTLCCRAFHHARCDAEAPPLELDYNEWTPIATNRSIPREADVDWVKGVARAPASWELRLDSSRFCFYDLEAKEPLRVDASDVFSLEDVRPSMTIRTILKHASKWMRSSASPAIAQAVDHENLRLAIVPEGVLPPAVDATAYKAGDHVQYRCRDGPRTASLWS